MKILHVFRSKPDEMVRELIRRGFGGDENREEELDRDVVDYDALVKAIFDSERVICWW